jgi:hypothetical protein
MSVAICDTCKTPRGPRQVCAYPEPTIMDSCVCQATAFNRLALEHWNAVASDIVQGNPLIAAQLHRAKVERELDAIVGILGEIGTDTAKGAAGIATLVAIAERRARAGNR